MKIIRYNSEPSGLVKIKCEKRVSNNRKGFTWMIEADIIKHEKVKTFESMTFEQDQNTVFLELKLIDGFVGIYLRLKSPSQAIVKFELSLLKNDDTAYTRSVPYYITLENGFGWAKFIEKDKLLDKDFSKDGYVTFTCLLKVWKGSNEDLVNAPINYKGLSGCFLPLVNNNDKHPDVTFVLKDKEFKAHRAILAARSENMNKLFKDDFAKNKDSVMKLDDTDPDVFHEFLVYIYTNKIPKLDTMADKLLVIAHKFKLEHLATACDIELIRKLKVENVANFLKLAQSCARLNLMHEVVNFIKENYESVTKDDSWLELKKTDADLTIKALESVVNKF